MIKEVDEDNDGKVSLREFFLIFRKAAKKELKSAVPRLSPLFLSSIRILFHFELKSAILGSPAPREPRRGRGGRRRRRQGLLRGQDQRPGSSQEE